MDKPRVYLPSLLDQNFGLCISPQDLLLPYYSLPNTNYYRPWKWYMQNTKDFGSTIADEKHTFKIFLDVQHFEPGEINVKVSGNEVIIEGNHEERKVNHGFISRRFKRRYILPKECNVESVVSSLSSDGVLIVTAEKNKDRKEIKVPVKLCAPCPSNELLKPDADMTLESKAAESYKKEVKDIKTDDAEENKEKTAIMLKEDSCRLQSQTADLVKKEVKEMKVDDSEENKKETAIMLKEDSSRLQSQTAELVKKEIKEMKVDDSEENKKATSMLKEDSSRLQSQTAELVKKEVKEMKVDDSEENKKETAIMLKEESCRLKSPTADLVKKEVKDMKVDDSEANKKETTIMLRDHCRLLSSEILGEAAAAVIGNISVQAKTSATGTSIEEVNKTIDDSEQRTKEKFNQSNEKCSAATIETIESVAGASRETAGMSIETLEACSLKNLVSETIEVQQSSSSYVSSVSSSLKETTAKINEMVSDISAQLKEAADNI